jgi:predicted nuclease of predicted toxin-antitoxin system
MADSAVYVGLPKVEHINQTNLKGHEDREIYAYVRKTGKVLITHDEDFLNHKL